jgi:hypothetical protein
MTRAILAIVIGLFAPAGAARAEPRIDNILLVAAGKGLPEHVSTNEIVRALETGLSG